MSDLAAVQGFDTLWAPVGGRRVSDTPVLGAAHGGRGEVKARLARVVARAPEVMVKITGKTRDGAHLQAHLAYITRDGALTLEGRDGERLDGLKAVRELGADWAAEDIRRRKDAALSLSLVLSMPPGTDELRMRDAARAFARETFAERHDYAFALHTDAGHPHVHLSVRSLGENGRRLNPRKADLEDWRSTFARTLRERGIAAEATLRRTRGITRKAERTAVRKIRERYEKGRGEPPRVTWAAYREAAAIVRTGERGERPWEGRILKRQQAIRTAYGEAARALAGSGDAEDRRLAEQVRRFVDSLPEPSTRRNELVRAMRALSGDERGREAGEPGRGAPDPSRGGRER